MNGDLISRSALLKFPIRANCYDKEHGNKHFIFGIESVMEYAENLPAVDAVSREVVEQIMWERDVAMEQLKEHGIPFGGIAPDVVEVCRCKDCKYWKCRRMGLAGKVGDCCNDDFPLICESRPVMKADAFCSYGEREDAK